ncbi:MAG TPA: FAD-dependent monooxygenase, partial [Ktedonobacterales bacterium]|nr:FAD-dependent monooxygenase [Ktedonobacterales bacterium]
MPMPPADGETSAPFVSQSEASAALYDVVVVGASFAGLTFASVAATRGLRVLVLERDPVVGGVVRTTGILFSDVFDVMEVPQRFLMNSVRRLRMRTSDGEGADVEIGAGAYRFYMADVTGMLQWMAEQAEGHGAVARCGAIFQDAVRQPDGLMQILYTQAGASGAEAEGTQAQTVRARFLIGADGTRSRVAQKMELDQNTHVLAGAEWLVENVKLDGETFYLIF